MSTPAHPSGAVHRTNAGDLRAVEDKGDGKGGGEGGSNSSQETRRRLDVLADRILIIGGGPSGLVTLSNLIERGGFRDVQLVERRDDIGGVWYLDPLQENSSEGNLKEKQSQVDLNPSSPAPPRWPSPAFPNLIGNVSPEFLGFSGYKPFPETGDANQPFPTLDETYRYLKELVSEKGWMGEGRIRLGLEVVGVDEMEKKDGEGGWKVTMRDWRQGKNGEAIVENWDRVVVANGWYDNPVWPDTQGLERLRELGLARHAKWWRGPGGCERKKFLVVGNAHSANEIVAQLAEIAHVPVYQSVRRPNFPGFPALADERIVKVAPVSRYIVREDSKKESGEEDANPWPNGRIGVELADGTKLENIDLVILGSGYKPGVNFVNVLQYRQDQAQESTSTQQGDAVAPSTITAERTHRHGHRRELMPLVSADITPYRIPSLHRYILYAYNTSLAFIGVPMTFTPFITADMCSTWLSLVWNGELRLHGSPEELLAFERERIKIIEDFRKTCKPEEISCFYVYNVLGLFEQGYGEGLRKDVTDVRPEWGDVLPEWSDERTRVREEMHRRKYRALEYARDAEKLRAMKAAEVAFAA